MVAYAKRNVAMLTTVGAMVAAVLLIIFFGAWAVSDGSRAADAETLLSGATAGFSGTTLAPPPQSPSSYPADGDADADATTAPRLATAPDGSVADGSAANPADTWWGKAFLAACPLH